ncbi:MAG: hypothetical protein AAGA80_05740 [Cyanobacteria bacterium P01_F01_bin.143]
MTTRTGIIFNGAASYISQEVAILDLLMGNGEDLPGMGLNFQEDVTFIAGLSSGALMTFMTNIAFSEETNLTWKQFKEDILFPLKTENIYLENEKLPHDTTPLKELLTGVSGDNGLKYLKDLSFDSAIITTSPEFDADADPESEEFIKRMVPCWITNIEDVGQKLPNPYPKNDRRPYSKIKEHHPNIEVVSALMCSTAIPKSFPSSNLYRKGSLGNSVYIGMGVSGLFPAPFIDGGASFDGAFGRFEEFFDVYNQQFDKIYIISPNYVPSEDQEAPEPAVQQYLLNDEEDEFDVGAFMAAGTQLFLRKMVEYNRDQKLAKEIFYCSPDVTGYESLDFSKQREQYDETIQWGLANPEDIAIDINTMVFQVPVLN